MKLTTTFHVPDRGRFTTTTPDLQATTDWGRHWSRPRHPDHGDILGQHLYDLRFDTTQGAAIFGKIRWSNGAVLPDGSGFCGRVYYDHLSVTLDDPAWSIVALPRLGARIAIDPSTGRSVWTVAARQVHVMQPRDIIPREFVLVPRGHEAYGLAILRRQVPIPRFGPKGAVRSDAGGQGYGALRTELPAVPAQQYQGTWSTFAGATEDAIARGTTLYLQDVALLSTGPFGPAHPQGADTAYSQGGLDIDPYTGFEGCPAGQRLNALLHGLTMERSAMALYHAQTGAVLRLDQWANADLGHLQLMKGETGEFLNQLELPAFLVGSYDTYRHRVFNPGQTCAYEQARAKFKLPDVAHSRRISVNAEPLAELEGCPMAIEDLALLFEHCRHGALSNRLDEQVVPSYPGQYLPVSLTRAVYGLRIAGGIGAGFDRAMGWSMLHNALALRHIPAGSAAAIALEAWGALAREAYVRAADRDTGIVQRDGPRPELPAGVQATQTFHSGILALGAIAQGRSAPSDAPFTREIAAPIERLVFSVLGSTTLRLVDDPYQGISFGPPHWIWTYVRLASAWARVFPLDNAHSTGGGDPVHWMAVVAEAYRLTRNTAILNLGLGLQTPSATLADRLAWLNSPNYPLAARAQTAGYEAALEEVLA